MEIYLNKNPDEIAKKFLPRLSQPDFSSIKEIFYWFKQCFRELELRQEGLPKDRVDLTDLIFFMMYKIKSKK